MRTRMAVLVVVIAAVVTGCGGDEKEAGKPSAPLTEITVSCDKFADTAKRITDAQTALYSGTDAKTAIDQLVGELEQLKDGAPADVETALDDLVDGFRDAEQLMADPTDANKEDLAKVSADLAKDGRRITAYIVSKCD